MTSFPRALPWAERCQPFGLMKIDYILQSEGLASLSPGQRPDALNMFLGLVRGRWIAGLFSFRLLWLEWYLLMGSAQHFVDRSMPAADIRARRGRRRALALRRLLPRILPDLCQTLLQIAAQFLGRSNRRRANDFQRGIRRDELQPGREVAHDFVEQQNQRDVVRLSLGALRHVI